MQQSITRYLKLDSIDKQILQLISIVYAPATKTDIKQCISKKGIRGPDKRVLKTHDIDSGLSRLEDLGFLQKVSGKLRCDPAMVEWITRHALADGNFENMVEVVRTVLRVPHWSAQLAYPLRVRDLRIDLYLSDTQKVESAHAELRRQYTSYYVNNPPFARIFSAFNEGLFKVLSEALQAEALTQVLNHSLRSLEPALEAVAYVQQQCEQRGAKTPLEWRIGLGFHLLLRGETDLARLQFGQAPSSYLWAFDACLDFLEGRESIGAFEKARIVRRKEQLSRKRHFCFGDLFDVFYMLAFSATEGAVISGKELDLFKATESSFDHPFGAACRVLQEFHLCKDVDGSFSRGARDAIVRSWESEDDVFAIFFDSLTAYWQDAKTASRWKRALTDFGNRAAACGFALLEDQAAIILARFENGAGENGEKRANAPSAKLRSPRFVPWADFIRAKAPWEQALDALTGLYSSPKPDGKDRSDDSAAERMVWLLRFGMGWCEIEPREQKRKDPGSWSKGRKVALKHLFGSESGFAYLTPQDLKTCACIQHKFTQNYRGYGEDTYCFDQDKALVALVGHPNIFFADQPEIRVELIRGEPEIVVEREHDFFSVKINPPIKEDKRTVIIQETPTRFKVVEVLDPHARIARILGKNGLKVPVQAKEKVLKAIGAITSLVTVQSGIAVDVGDAEQIASDSRTHLYLLPSGQGLNVELLVCPLPGGGGSYQPGAGGATVIAAIQGKRMQTTRDLEQEKENARLLRAACPTLGRLEEAGNGKWAIAEPQDCLELLFELKSLDEDQVVVEWPQGQSYSVRQEVSADRFRLNIKREKDWFSLDGEIRLDDNRVLNMKELLDLLDNSPGRFVALGDGGFLALTRAFRNRLDELRSFSQGQDEGVRLHPLAAAAFEDWFEEAGAFKADKHWKEHLKRLHSARDLKPVVPSTLQCELRNYQIDGFRWLARLAHWGVGACLADDMGLGKTVQALAVILERAADGPTLVVAPTSVCMNWEAEAQKFAPTLNLRFLGAGDRQEILDALGPFDLLICSYALMQQEAKALAQLNWRTIVLDEAQAIKNMATKRSQAAMDLRGDFKIIATGTPVENHLGELWNLFRFINPGLLGSLQQFTSRFALPIERDRDQNAQARLKKLIRPFILRRLKAQVLEELPPRVEILLRVEPSRDEAAFYEALRRKALDRLEGQSDESGKRNMMILAEIMRLRRACCHGRLVMPDAPIESSKLELFGHTLTEILENRHKVLVFSQFVDYLEIVRAFIEERGIAYQYLDGATSMKDRAKRVAAFQAGEGDVFLISLRAGGQGLNLTAADYVIHMDPWWNPAVEDQASDRVHRIGQQRPVTIYRLVAKHTIEEKIVDLHRHKRDLAEGLLEGGDMSGRMSADELLRLLRDEAAIR